MVSSFLKITSQHPLQPRAPGFLPALTAGILAGLITLTITCLSGAALYVQSTRALQNEVRSNLTRIATVAAATVDGDLHRTFISRQQNNSPAYAHAIEPLVRVQKASGDIKFIYTCILKQNNVYFILDATPPGDADGDGVDDKSYIMQPYPEAADPLVNSLRSHRILADTKPFGDQWGTFISGYAPIYDSRHQFVGVVGVDLTGQGYVARLSAIRHAGLMGVAFASLLSLGIGVGIFFSRRREVLAAVLLIEAHRDMEGRVQARTADLAEANNRLAFSYDATIEGWSRALDLRDHETQGHSERVTEMTLRLAHTLGMDGEALVHIRRGALLHDIGKMGVPDSVLLKPGPLTEEEWGLMRRHPSLAYEMLAPIEFLRPALDIPWCHHEKWDGSGYPRGLAGENIPLAARLFALVDVWDALSSDRPYRRAWEPERVLDHLSSLSGTHFEPRLVEVFLRLLTLQEKSKVKSRPLMRAA